MKSYLGSYLHGADDQYKTFGTEDLCTWCNPGEPGVCTIQTRRPDFARKLSKRSDTGLLRKQWAGDYLRIFRARMEPWKARQLVNRYLKAANEGFSELEAPQRVETASAGWLVRPGKAKSPRGCKMPKTSPRDVEISLGYFANFTGSDSDSFLLEEVAAD